MRREVVLGGAVSALALSSAAVAQSADDESVDELIVTGVFREQAIEEAPVAITALSEEELVRAAPLSAADLLRAVPGVYVNSALGEIRNVVYSRGVAAGSTEASRGYFYVSLQEDGLPVSNILSTNYGPDYFLRPDLTLKRLEALRGGTATITGPNAPGGIFNYISKDGRSDPGTEVAVRLGLEGDGQNPYYRADFYHGGQVPGAENLYYSVGGFYRSADGARYPGYPLNEGGQVKANLIWEYDRGELFAGVKYLNDRNGWFEFLPARDYDNPRLVEGISATDSFLPPAAPHSWVDPYGERQSWDGSNLVESEQFALTAKWTHDFGDGWNVNNSFRFADSTADWNTGAAIFPVPVNDPFVYILTNTFGYPGTFSFRDPESGALVAEVVSNTGFDHTVVSADLPNPAVQQDGVLTQVAFDPLHEAQEIMNQFIVSKEWERHAVTAGVFYGYSELFRQFSGGGIGISGIENRPSLYDITLTLPGGGPTLEVTSPEGFASLGDALSGGNRTDGSQEQLSLFFGHNFQMTDRLTLDWGVRYEDVTLETTNIIGAAPPNFGDPTEGGTDGNPLTLFDNFPNVPGAPISAEREYDYLSYSVSLGYELTPQLQTYARYSNGQKAPDFQSVIDLDTPNETESLFIEAQEIQQFELGIKYAGDRISIAAFPFWSELGNVVTPQLFLDGNGIPYSPPPVGGMITTLGIEFEGDVELTESLSLRAAITVQSAEAEDFGIFAENTPDRNDDTFVPVPPGDGDNIPDVLSQSTLIYQPNDRFDAFVTWNYIGDRAANRFNAFELPGFHTVDAGAGYRLTDQLQLRFDVKNALNEENGVMSWSPAGGFLQSLDRQALTPAQVAANPDQAFNVVTAQPRAYFFTASYAF